MIAPLLVSLALSQVAPDATLRRFALVAGANDGGSGRVTLRYATSDARAVSHVLTQLGGVSERDLVVVENPSTSQLNQAFAELATRVGEARSSRARTEVVFYYSGHSDEDGLLLPGGERLSYAALRSRLDSTAAEVRIAVLDSCASGAMTRSKGGVARPSFLVDQSSQLVGHAFLTSASADEAAQESERLKASIFTHFFLSGLRGAADSSHDGRVTLGEAYQYAFAETLARTTSTRAGPQRPGYDIQLVGTGDLVLTDVRSATSRLVLDATVGGRVYVLGAQGGLVVEVAKAPGKPIELGLEPGEYRVVVDEGTKTVGEAHISLATGDSKALSRASLEATSLEATILRGDEPLPRPWLPVDLAFVYPVGITGYALPAPRINAGLGVIAERVGAVHGATVSGVVGWVDDEVNGVGVAGVFLKTGALRGLGVAGALLVSTGDVVGLTATTLAITHGNVIGLQASALNLTTGTLTGLQAGAGNLAAGGFIGVQAAVVNVAVEPSWGLQAGALNFGGELVGSQLGVGNFSGGGFGGLQAGAANVATGTSWGAQVGVVNIGGDVVGSQVGVLNIASHVRGAQLGVLNIAQTSDAPVGLLNIITHGRVKLAAWTNETSVANLAFKIGGEHVYSSITLGLNPRGSSGKPHFSYGFGLGLRAGIDRWYGELEASFEDLHQFNPGLMWVGGVFSTGLRVNIGYQLLDGVAVFAGPQVHVMMAYSSTQTPASLTPWGFDLTSQHRLVPGFVLGAQFL